MMNQTLCQQMVHFSRLAVKSPPITMLWSGFYRKMTDC
ncbi:hypothetical protein CSC18_3540 [Klebsiella aerogenes]|nr:hypothetical protein CSC18_3540 [Klebsiella aerogenes]